MSIFRSNSPSADLSALLDDELSPHDAQQLAASLREGSPVFKEYARAKQVHAMLVAPRVSDDRIAAAQERVRLRLERSIRAVHQRDQRAWWERSVTIPMPVAATAMIAIMLFAVILAGRFAVPGSPVAAGSAQPSAGTVADRAESVNVQVNVDGDQTEQLLQWLNERQSVETVTIQLPDTAQFQLRGEPVFLRPDLPGEEGAVADEDLEITPLEESEE
ncbi:MAG: hypothetical protein ACOCU4_10340 [Alkalispirochaeta sp.]